MEIVVSEAGGMTGAGTIVLFFQQLVFPGFAICLRLALERPTLANVLASLAGIVLPVQIAIGGRREPTVLLGMTIMLGLYFARHIRPPRWLIPLAMAAAMLAIPATGTYRGLHAEKNWEGIRQIDLVGNFKRFLTEESILELRNGAAVIEATKALGTYQYGAGYWNHMVFRYVPAQLVGPELKGRLKIAVSWDIVEAGATETGFQLSRGSTITGMGDSFQQFGWFGCVFFALMAVLFRTLWVAALSPGALFAQLLYIATCTSAMRAVTHWTLDFLPGLVYNVIFLGLGVVYAAAAGDSRGGHDGRSRRRDLPGHGPNPSCATSAWDREGCAKHPEQSQSLRQ
jgi:hypothetical protein